MYNRGNLQCEEEFSVTIQQMKYYSKHVSFNSI